MTNATSRPWELHTEGSIRICVSNAIVERGCRSVAEAEILGMSREQAVANAELIVKAVNSHDVLVAALEAAVAYAVKQSDPNRPRVHGVGDCVASSPGTCQLARGKRTI